MSVPPMPKKAATATAAQARSATRATPCPPPMQSEATPSRASRSAMTCRSVTSTRAPLAPMGCPTAIAPPCTVTRFLGMRSPRSTPSDCAANASLSSQRSTSSRRSLARARAVSAVGRGLPALQRGGRLLLALGGEVGVGLAADAVHGGEGRRGDADVDEGKRAGEQVGEQRVEDVVVARADAQAGLLHDVGHAAHAL